MLKNLYSNKGLGLAIKSIRRSSGITINELADKLDISPKTLSRIEKAETPITVNKYFELCETLDVSPIDILEKVAGIERADYASDWPRDAQVEYRFLVEYLKAKYNLN